VRDDMTFLEEDYYYCKSLPPPILQQLIQSSQNNLSPELYKYLIDARTVFLWLKKILYELVQSDSLANDIKMLKRDCMEINWRLNVPKLNEAMEFSIGWAHIYFDMDYMCRILMSSNGFNNFRSMNTYTSIPQFEFIINNLAQILFRTIRKGQANRCIPLIGDIIRSIELILEIEIKNLYYTHSKYPITDDLIRLSLQDSNFVIESALLYINGVVD